MVFCFPLRLFLILLAGCIQDSTILESKNYWLLYWLARSTSKCLRSSRRLTTWWGRWQIYKSQTAFQYPHWDWEMRLRSCRNGWLSQLGRNILPLANQGDICKCKTYKKISMAARNRKMKNKNAATQKEVPKMGQGLVEARWVAAIKHSGKSPTPIR